MGYSRRIPFIVAAANFMETLDGSIVTTALPAIAGSYHRPPLTLTLGVSAYLIAVTACVPAAGWASERFGARNLFAAAIAVFTLASLACGLSPTPACFYAARTLQGCAAAFMSPVGRVVVLRETPKQYIIEALGMIVWPALIAPVVGPPLAGFLTLYASWRWIFFLNVPVGLLGMVLVLSMIPAYPKERHVPFDTVGFLWTATALAASVEGLSLLGESGRGLVRGATLLLVGSICALIALRHARSRTHPMLDLRAAAVPTFAISTLSVGILARTAINATPFLLPLLFQIGFGMNAFEAGSMLLVYMLGNLVMKSVTTPLLRQFGFARVLIVNGALCAVTIAACGWITPSAARALVYVTLFVAGMTRSMHFTTIGTLSFVDIAPAERAGASSLATMAQQFASALGVAAAALALGLSQHARGATQPALADFRHALWASAVIMAISVVLSLKLPRDAGAEVSQRA